MAWDSFFLYSEEWFCLVRVVAAFADDDSFLHVSQKWEVSAAWMVA
jgi:hypothetical protein